MRRCEVGTRGDGGFTIMETLVAFALLSLLLVSLYGAGGTALKSADRATGIDRAVMLAESKLAEFTAMRTALPDSGRGTFAGTGVAWRMEARPIAGVGAANLHLQEVHLELSWTEDGHDKRLAVDTRHLGRAAQ